MFNQIGAVTNIALRSLPLRIATSLVVVVGIAGVVAVLLSVLSLSRGLEATLASTGKPDRAIVLADGAQSEVASGLRRSDALTILDAPGVLRDADGKPLASAETIASVPLIRRDNGRPGTATLRGASQQAFAMRPEIRLTEGRMFQPGLREVVVGKSTQNRFVGIEVGKTVHFGQDEWNVVGIFESGGDSYESALFADADTVLSAYQRVNFNSVTVRLTSEKSFDEFKTALTTNPTLSVEVRREPEYYQQQSQGFSRFLAIIANVVAIIMGVGAVFAALNTMYSSVAARTVEIATLRALGFGSGAVVISVLVEAMLLALIGALVGAALAWLVFNGNTVATIAGGNSGLSQVVFHLRIGGALIVAGIVWACVIGLIGGLLPAIRAARVPIVVALRAV